MKSLNQVYSADALQMGEVTVLQPLPLPQLEQVSPFLLLHHFGPFDIEPGHNPMDIGAHPHRGFEPVTFLFQGELEHKDSRGNEGVIRAGGVQWMTAGMGIVHSERASKNIVEQGGTLEGIQLWVNLPASMKAVQPRYQQADADQIPQLEGDLQGVALVAGQIGSQKGAIETHTPVLAAMLNLDQDQHLEIPVPEGQQSLIYILDGNLEIGETRAMSHQMITFSEAGDSISIKAMRPTKALLLSGQAIDEPVVSWGPYVMNTQTEIMEAMRDYQMGKMGILID